MPKRQENAIHQVEPPRSPASKMERRTIRATRVNSKRVCSIRTQVCLSSPSLFQQCAARPCKRRQIVDATALPSARTSAIGTTTIGVAVRGASGGHATQLVLACELTAKLGELGDEVLGDFDKSVFGRDGAVGLDANEELRYIRVSDCARYYLLSL